MIADRIPLFSPGFSRLQALGVDVHQVLRQAGVSAVSQTLTTKQYFSLWAAIESVSHDDLIGLRLGGIATLEQLDPATFAALHASTFGHALQRMARYKRLSCPEIIRIEPDNTHTRISFHWRHAKQAAPRALTDAAFANVQLLLTSGTGKQIPPAWIERTQRSNGTQHYATHFACSVHEEVAADAMVYSNEVLETPFLKRDQSLITALLPTLDAQLSVQSSLLLENQAKVVLIRMMGGDRPSIQTLATQLKLSPRTLQRRLLEAQTSYQTLLDAVRLELACNLLEHTHQSPGEIAFTLGFEEINSFQRAFQHWQGMTPNQWRTERGAIKRHRQ